MWMWVLPVHTITSKTSPVNKAREQSCVRCALFVLRRVLPSLAVRSSPGCVHLSCGGASLL